MEIPSPVGALFIWNSASKLLTQQQFYSSSYLCFILKGLSWVENVNLLSTWQSYKLKFGRRRDAVANATFFSFLIQMSFS